VRQFEPRSGQTKDYKIGICCFSAKNAAIRRKANIIGAIYLSADYSFSKLALCKIQKSVLVLYEADLIINSLKISLFSAWYSWNKAELALNNNHMHSPTHSLTIYLFVPLFCLFCLFVCLFVCLFAWFCFMLFRYCIYSILFVCLFVLLQSNPPFIQKLLGHSAVVLAMLSSHRWIIRFENILWIYLWVRRFGLLSLTPISTICQLYHDS
jgi:hypothetical protein